MENAPIKSAQATLNELRGGKVLIELAAAINEATKAVRDHGKPAEVNLTIAIKPFDTKGLAESPITFLAEVTTKLPKQPPEPTLFFIDKDGNPTRTPQVQPELPAVSVIGHQQKGAA